ncbi:MAG: GNAT family N-acetyltransferase [Lachnospiraceae bacterium]|nr:GNAT family N-acetyltransferase [Lachnospiraceae bacterium]
MITYKEFNASLLEDVKEIYRSVYWQTYLQDDEKLKRAFDNSLNLLGAFDGEVLVGFARCVGDGEHIVLVQDLAVRLEYQKKRIGTTLFRMVWEKYKDVRMFQVVTDLEDEVDNHFYQSFGMKKLEEGHMVSYFR